MTGNNAPKTFWKKTDMADGTIRYELLVDNTRTPYFIDKAAHVEQRFTHDKPFVLYGAGMGEMTSAGYRIAATLNGFSRISQAKHHAEQCALGS